MRRGFVRGGFTLLEVVLALGLTVVVMSAIGVAIFLHLRAVDHTRLATERDQLARILLRRIGDDLRSAVRREPPDEAGMKALQTMMQSAKNAGKSGGGKSGSGSAGQASGEGSDSAAKGRTKAAGTTGTTSEAGATGTTQRPDGADDSATESADESTAGTPAAVAGLYGTAYDLQIDLARVPRPDEFTTAMISGTSAPSDVRTVYYFLANAATGLSPTGESGLMRSEMNRAEALYASENGDIDIFLRTGELMADEVMALEFRYFDGLEWFTEWNSQDMNGLPMAVEMAIMLFDPRTADETMLGGSLFDPAAAGLDQELVYRTMVRLPSAQLAQSTSGGSSTSDSGSTDTGSNSSDSSASATSGGGGQ